MAFGLSQKSTTTYNSLYKSASSVDTGPDLDFDMLVTRVESTLHEDDVHQRFGITPQELMMRSNPSLYQPEVDNFLPKDLANPREVYSILSHKSKSIEDLAAKLKQELARSVQATGTLPKLSRALSMNDLEHKTDKSNRPKNKTESYGITQNSQRRLNLLTLKRHNTVSNDTLKTAGSKTAENKGLLSLPTIDKKAVLTEHGTKTRFELDQLTERTECEADDLNARKVDIKEVIQDRSVEEKYPTSGQEAKLNKWFSEMPNEVFDKAQRAIMEESIKDRLQEFQRRRRKNYSEFPHPAFHVNISSKFRNIPSTYLELRVDSFGRHLHNEKNDKMMKYRLQQKSMHNLKMRESVETELGERLHREEAFPRLFVPNKPTKQAKLKKPDQEQTGRKKEQRFHIENGVKTVYMNDVVASDFEMNMKPKHGHTNYEEYTERMAMMKEHSMYLSNMEGNFEYDHPHADSEKHASKAAVVNLTLEQETAAQKKSKPLDKSCNESNTEPQLERVSDADNDAKGIDEDEYTDEQKSKPDHIITKIPTAQSIRTSDTRSSNSSVLSKSNKEAMKKFNKLEVFSESQPFTDYDPSRDHFSTGRHHTSTETSGAKRSDGKPQKKLVVGNSNAVQLQDIRQNEPEVVFRFEPGEVFIQKIPRKHGNTHARNSERARIIYGKTLQGVNDRNSSERTPITNKRQDKNTGNSAVTNSTKLDRYKSDINHYESRALNESLGTTPVLDDSIINKSLVVSHTTLINRTSDKDRNQKLTRDVAIETDIIGSVKGLDLQGSNEEKMIDDPEALVDRSDSELSDFIVENNEGESLDSEDEECGDEERCIQSTISV